MTHAAPIPHVEQHYLTATRVGLEQREVDAADKAQLVMARSDDQQIEARAKLSPLINFKLDGVPVDIASDADAALSSIKRGYEPTLKPLGVRRNGMPGVEWYRQRMPAGTATLTAVETQLGLKTGYDYSKGVQIRLKGLDKAPGPDHIVGWDIARQDNGDILFTKHGHDGASSSQIRQADGQRKRKRTPTVVEYL